MVYDSTGKFSTATIEINAKGTPPGGTEKPLVPGYDMLIFLGTALIATVIIFRRRHKFNK